MFLHETFVYGLLLVAFACSSVAGFSVGNPKSAGAIRPDASSAVEEALKITASFGIDSKEARVAWDIVEEMDSSDNRYGHETVMPYIHQVAG